MNDRPSGPDPVVNSDRLTGSTAPESGSESSNVVGRPAVEKPPAGFHEPAETPDTEAEPFDRAEALEEGGSFDGVAPLQDMDDARHNTARK